MKGNQVEKGSEGLHVSRSAERAIALLEAVVQAGQVTLTEAAKALSLPPSTAKRHLRVLEIYGFISRASDKTYSAGPTFIRLALHALTDGPTAHLIATSQPYLDRLAATTQESCYLAVRDGTEALYLATAESPLTVRHVGWVGRSVPIKGTAVGAALTVPDVGSVHTNTGKSEQEVTAISATISPPNGPAIAALSVLGPAYRLRRDKLAEAKRHVTKIAAELGIALGRGYVN